MSHWDYDPATPEQLEAYAAKAREAKRIADLGFTPFDIDAKYIRYTHAMHSCNVCAALVIDPDKHREVCAL